MEKRLYVSCRNGDQIEEVKTIDEGIDLIKAYIKEDHEESGCADPGFYEIEDDDHMTIWYDKAYLTAWYKAEYSNS